MNRNSALLWLPKIEAAGLPTPNTVVVPYSHHACLSIFDGQASDEFSRLIEVVKAVNRWPAFVRTDLGSAKHSGPKAYKITEAGDVPRVLSRLIEDMELKFWLEREGPAAILIRQWIDLDGSFTAFAGTLISREWRFFADGEQVYCYHPYWPFEAFENWQPFMDPTWRESLAELHQDPINIDELKAMAIKAAGAQGGGSWSVDIARDRDGKWWLIDMAVAEDSWHWKDCPFKEAAQV